MSADEYAITDDELTDLQDILDTNQQFGSEEPGDSEPHVSTEECVEWRDLADDGLSPYQIAKRTDAARGTVRWHLDDRCTHTGAGR